MIDLVFMYLAFFIASGISSMIGIGGGVLYVPILLAFGFPFYQAAAISIFIIMALSISASSLLSSSINRLEVSFNNRTFNCYYVSCRRLLFFFYSNQGIKNIIHFDSDCFRIFYAKTY